MLPIRLRRSAMRVVWAWQTLRSSAPFAAPAEDLSTISEGYHFADRRREHANRFSTSQSLIDARTKFACENAKKADITIYTVLVIDGTQSLLQACASDSKKYFYLQSARGLVSAFNQIGTDLTNLRVSK